MRLEEILNEQETMGTSDKMIYIGNHTKIVGDFLNNKKIIIRNPTPKGKVVKVDSSSPSAIESAHKNFSKRFNVSSIKSIGQSMRGFEFSVGNLTIDKYVSLLEKIYKSVKQL